MSWAKKIISLTIAIGLIGSSNFGTAVAERKFNAQGKKTFVKPKVNLIKEKAKTDFRYKKFLEDITRMEAVRGNFDGNGDELFGKGYFADDAASNKTTKHDGCLWVAEDGSGDFTDIQSAVNVAASGDSVCVVAGNYKALRSDAVLTWFKKDLKILGGFRSVNGLRDVLGESVIDGAGKTRCIVTKHLSAESEFSGFTVTACAAKESDWGKGSGAAMLNIGSDLLVRDNLFSMNRSKALGGAMYNFNSNVQLISDHFLANESGKGGAVASFKSDVMIEKCRFTDNLSDKRSSAVLHVSGDLKAVNSLFSGNQATKKYSSVYDGAAVFLVHATAQVLNVTFSKNAAHSSGAKARAVLVANPKELVAVEITNSLLRDGGNEIAILREKSQTPLVRFSNVEGGYAGEGNIDLPALFTDQDAGELSLMNGSPSIDTGTSEGAPADDILGTARPSGDGVDMGAYEAVVMKDTSALQVSAGGYHNCALLENNEVHCWGAKDLAGDFVSSGQDQGYISTDPNIRVVKVTSGREFNCVLLSDGNVSCWGANTFGELEYINPLGTKLVDIDSGNTHTCGITEDGFVICWGSNLDEYGNFAGQSINYSPADPNAKALKITSGGYHSCALLDNGTVHCWGSNDDIIPALANQAQDYTPEPGTHVVDVSTGEYHSCALLDTGGVHCWGTEYDGSGVFKSTQSKDYVPADENAKAVKLSCGGFHNCVALADGGSHCWGWNIIGQSDPFTPVNPSLKVTDVADGYAHSCFLLSNGEVDCQGWDSYGQAENYLP